MELDNLPLGSQEVKRASHTWFITSILLCFSVTVFQMNEYSDAIVHAFRKFRVLPQLSVNGIETKVLK